MENSQILKTSDMLHQHEFKERFSFIAQRVLNGLSRLDLAFLMGRSNERIIYQTKN